MTLEVINGLIIGSLITLMIFTLKFATKPLSQELCEEDSESETLQ